MNSNYKFTYVSTFAGCGRSSLGYTLAGGKGLLAVEFNENAMKTYHLNHPTTPIYYGDIHNLTEEKIKKLIPNFQQGKTVDILDGSPPCQGFSQAGKCNPNDIRNTLYKQYIRVLNIIKPKVSIIENVKALTFKRNRHHLKGMLNDLIQSGYTPRLKVMNAKYYNCATSRERLIVISSRNDLKIIPTFPEHSPKLVSIKDALKDVTPSRIKLPTDNKLKYLKQCKPGENLGKYHPKGNYFGTYLLNTDGQAPTILKGSGSGFFVPYRDTYRELTANELQVLQSFPKSYKFTGGENNAHNRIGNSVPPMMMKAIANHVYNTILNKK